MTSQPFAWLKKSCPVLAFGALAIFTGFQRAAAEYVVFTIDPNLSIHTNSGFDDVYGVYEEQSPGSLTAPISGHFLVRFDPSTSTPSEVQFIGGHGFFEVGDATSSGNPGPGGAAYSAPANGAGQTAGGDRLFAMRDVVWDFYSAPIARVNGSNPYYPATQSDFVVLSGSQDWSFWGNLYSEDYTGYSDGVSSGKWYLTESSPGHWTLEFDGYYESRYAWGTAGGTRRNASTVVATAEFGADNIAAIPDGGTQAEALGGASTPGGVSASFSQPISGGGELTVQQVPDFTGMSRAAFEAAESNPEFLLTANFLSTGLPVQIWNVDFAGDLGGATATLVFHYDDQGMDPYLEQLLGIWHFSDNEWEFGGDVDPVANTVTFTTDNFSPFVLGVPEPSSLVLALGALAALAACAYRRHTGPTA